MPRSATADRALAVSRDGAGRTAAAGCSDACVSMRDSTPSYTFLGLRRCYRCRPGFAVQPVGGSDRLIAVGRARPSNGPCSP